MIDINKLRCKIRTMQEITRQDYIAKRKELDEYKADKINANNMANYVNLACITNELAGEVLAYEEVLKEINIFILSDMTGDK